MRRARLAEVIVVDTSAIAAIAFAEPERAAFVQAMEAAARVLISTMSVVEARMAVDGRRGTEHRKRAIFTSSERDSGFVNFPICVPQSSMGPAGCNLHIATSARHAELLPHGHSHGDQHLPAAPRASSF